MGLSLSGKGCDEDASSLSHPAGGGHAGDDRDGLHVGASAGQRAEGDTCAPRQWPGHHRSGPSGYRAADSVCARLRTAHGLVDSHAARVWPVQRRPGTDRGAGQRGESRRADHAGAVVERGAQLRFRAGQSADRATVPRGLQNPAVPHRSGAPDVADRRGPVHGRFSRLRRVRCRKGRKQSSWCPDLRVGCRRQNDQSDPGGPGQRGFRRDEQPGVSSALRGPRVRPGELDRRQLFRGDHKNADQPAADPSDFERQPERSHLPTIVAETP